MAGMSIDQESEDRKAGQMTSDSRIVHIEGRVDRLEGDVLEIKSGVKALLDRPQNPGFAQVIGTLLATLATCAIIFGFAEWRLREAVSPVGSALEKLDAKINLAAARSDENRLKNAVLEERSIWLKSQSGWKPE